MKKIIYFQFFCTDELGECDSFFEIVNGKLVCIAAWSCNDANYRSEYMNSLFSYLGVVIGKLPKKYGKKAEKLLRERWGL